MNKHEIKREESQNAIYGAARRLIAQKGFNGITLQDILKEADVTKGKFFHYFSGKDQLFSKLLNESLNSREFPSFEESIKGLESEGPLEKLIKILDHVISWHSHGLPEVMRLCVFATFFFAPDSSEIASIRKRIQANSRILTTLFKEAQERGQLSAEIDPEICALLFPSLGVGGNSVGYLVNLDKLTVKNLQEFKKMLLLLRLDTGTRH